MTRRFACGRTPTPTTTTTAHPFIVLEHVVEVDHHHLMEGRGG